MEESVLGVVRYRAGTGFLTNKDLTKLSGIIATNLNKQNGCRDKMIYDATFIDENFGGRGIRSAEEIAIRESVTNTRLTLADSAPRLTEIYTGI